MVSRESDQLQKSIFSLHEDKFILRRRQLPIPSRL